MSEAITIGRDTAISHDHKCPHCERVYACTGDCRFTENGVYTGRGADQYQLECIYCFRDGERDLSA